MAYVDLANRALCPGSTDVCDWKQQKVTDVLLGLRAGARGK